MDCLGGRSHSLNLESKKKKKNEGKRVKSQRNLLKRKVRWQQSRKASGGINIGKEKRNSCEIKTGIAAQKNGISEVANSKIGTKGKEAIWDSAEN